MKRLYVDVPREEALRRYLLAEPGFTAADVVVDTFTFIDEIGVYAAWKV